MSGAILTQGANAAMPAADRFKVVVSWKSDQGRDVDAAAFPLDAEGRSPDGTFVTRAKPKWRDGAIQLGGLSGTERVFEIDAAIGVDSIDFCLADLAPTERGKDQSSLPDALLVVFNATSGEEITRYALPTGEMKETAVVLGRLYRRNGSWKIRAVGQGFLGGLDPLAALYGIEGAASEARRPSPASVTPPPVPSASPVNLSKVTLEKRGQSVSLEKKKDKGFGEIRFNLNWDQRKKKGFLSGLLGGSKDIDLDLGCLFELQDGRKGAVQALGNSWGNFDVAPFIRHVGDDRTGAASEGETIRINGDKIAEIKSILVFAFIYEGVPNWSSANGLATVKVPGRADIEVRLDNASSDASMCAIALIENDGNDVKVTKEVRYFHGHSDMDEAYQWGLRWVAGSKD
jgi:tellurite resistance protein TerA